MYFPSENRGVFRSRFSTAKNCGKYHIDDASPLKRYLTLFRKEGSDAWYTHEANEILPKGTKMSSTAAVKKFTKETDIMDVWFDSGVSHAAVLDDGRDRYSNGRLDLYLEGADQYRGWFQSSLLTSVAWKGVAPYKAVCTHGWVVDGAGQKTCHKSLGNGIAAGRNHRRIRCRYPASVGCFF